MEEINFNKTKKEKKTDLNTRVGKYFIAKQNGSSKTEASIIAGYPSPTHTTRIEQSGAYRAIEKLYYKDELLKQITLRQIAEEQIKNIIQDSDKGAKNKAIEMALNRLEPNEMPSDENDGVIIVLG